jgi:hypothetical protein
MFVILGCCYRSGSLGLVRLESYCFSNSCFVQVPWDGQPVVCKCAVHSLRVIKRQNGGNDSLLKSTNDISAEIGKPSREFSASFAVAIPPAGGILVERSKIGLSESGGRFVTERPPGGKIVVVAMSVGFGVSVRVAKVFAPDCDHCVPSDRVEISRVTVKPTAHRIASVPGWSGGIVQSSTKQQHRQFLGLVEDKFLQSLVACVRTARNPLLRSKGGCKFAVAAILKRQQVAIQENGFLGLALVDECGRKFSASDFERHAFQVRMGVRGGQNPRQKTRVRHAVHEASDGAAPKSLHRQSNFHNGDVLLAEESAFEHQVLASGSASDGLEPTRAIFFLPGVVRWFGRVRRKRFAHFGHPIRFKPEQRFLRLGAIGDVFDAVS